MPQFRRKAAIVLAMLSILAVAAPVAAKSGGNAAGSAACANGGFRSWTRANGTTFKNEGACTSYTAKGGVLKPVAPKVFARAWTDVNINHTYEATTDTLLGEVVDANNDGLLNAGDQVTTFGFPTAPGFIACSVTTRTVTQVDLNNAGVVRVLHASGRVEFGNGTGQHFFGEVGDGTSSAGDSLGVTNIDTIMVDPLSPCAPLGAASLHPQSTGDDFWLDVEILP